MHLSSILSVPALLLVPLAAQSVSVPLPPRATFLRTNNDSPANPVIVDLAALGATSGTWLAVGTTGACSESANSPDTAHDVIAVFSSSNVLLGTSIVSRVPGAIAAGPSRVSPPTFAGQLPTDVPEDFSCSRSLWGSGITVRVPNGAAFLFVGVFDSYYADNNDPNNDFAAVVSLVSPPTLPGTGEHLELRAAFGATPVAFPDLHTTTPGGPMIAELRYPLGLADGSLYLIVGDTVHTGTPPLQALPGLWTANPIVLRVGVLPGTPGWTDTWTASTPGGFGGTTLVIQGGALVPTARNGQYVTTNAHRFVL